MKEKKLYAQTVYGLYHTFQNDTLKAEIIIDKEFKQLVIQEICNLLTLEKDFAADLDGEKYTVAFAQVLADITNESAKIEKKDNAKFSDLDENHAQFVQYINQKFKFDRDDIIKEVTISAEIIDKTTDFVNKEESLAKARELSGSQLQSPVQPAQANQAPGAAPFVGMGAGMPQFDPSQMDMSKMMQQMADMPIHPRLDPRFYPYNTKPKYMLLMKKVVAGFVIFAAALLVLVWALGNFLPITVYPEGGFWTWHNESKAWIGGPGQPPSEAGKLGYDFLTSLMYKFGVAPGTPPLFNIFMPILPGLFLGYELLGAKKFRRDNYTVRILSVVLSAVLLAWAALTIVPLLIPSTLDNLINGLGMSKDGVNGGTVMPSPELPKLLNEIISLIRGSARYQALRIFSIVALSISLVAVLLTLALCIYAPRLDRQKLVRANEEYQKAVMAKMSGQKYEMDPTLFDDEFKDDSSPFKPPSEK
ncbi:hypothetical protein SSYRP_v1c01350 [Spiroplasma syrphidicola EA-1]|uniref:Transmembrane protein n=1 Tax=Spiroplasma syrphidicola EA-1 TaxID=1276229 RepID=R4UKD5_9MOLU|nr:hypothetical protein [Spiroplasma syrphidicola]AGM25731.1 hypothetical protein SSYRP_v1c01350 [Spiroplasma syrphidicola EA-1]